MVLMKMTVGAMGTMLTVMVVRAAMIIAVIRIMLRVRVTVSGSDNGGAGGGDS